MHVPQSQGQNHDLSLPHAEWSCGKVCQERSKDAWEPLGVLFPMASPFPGCLALVVLRMVLALACLGVGYNLQSHPELL